MHVCGWYVRKGVRGTSRRPRAGADRYEPDWAASLGWKLRQNASPSASDWKRAQHEIQLASPLVRAGKPLPTADQTMRLEAWVRAGVAYYIYTGGTSEKGRYKARMQTTYDDVIKHLLHLRLCLLVHSTAIIDGSVGFISHRLFKRSML